MNKEKIRKQLEKVLATENEVHLKLLQEALYEELFTMIYAIAKNRFPTDTEDVVHDFYVDKLFKIAPVKWQQVMDFLEPFVVRSLLNYCSTLGSRKKRRREVLNNDISYLNSETAITHNPIMQLHCSMDLDKALKTIPDRQRTAFVLHCKEGYKYKEFSDIMESSLSAGAAKQLVNRAKTNMRTWLCYQ